MMRFTSLVIAWSILLSTAYSQVEESLQVRLDAMEKFMTRQTARITWSREVGRIETDRASAVITALIAEDGTQNPSQIRGVRIDLASGDTKDTVYTREDLLDRLLKGLDDVAARVPDYFSGRGLRNPRSCSGSEVFWLQPGHAFSASICRFEDWVGLQVETGRNIFRFTGQDDSAFTAAILRAKEELKQR